MKHFVATSACLLVLSAPTAFPAAYYLVGGVFAENGFGQLDWNVKSNGVDTVDAVLAVSNGFPNGHAAVLVKYGALQLSAFASGGGSNLANFGHAWTFARWGDAFTIHAPDPGLLGSTGTLIVALQLNGTADVHEPPEWGDAGHADASYSLIVSTHGHFGDWIPFQASGSWSSDTGFTGVDPSSLTNIAMPIVFGEPIELLVALEGETGLDSSILTGYGWAKLDFSHTVEWGGH